ncbi:hypothetical protein CDAR_438551 [Caerostris darwini]|uniref:Uncharacterized protein n=1 Tax=Caerostris darwini TaxID=1538125 RepID=A0AAV4X0T9_9ARAC|nr:hypothetical protein CDAR_438551 [Caerostris darwini]
MAQPLQLWEPKLRFSVRTEIWLESPHNAAFKKSRSRVSAAAVWAHLPPPLRGMRGHVGERRAQAEGRSSVQGGKDPQLVQQVSEIEKESRTCFSRNIKSPGSLRRSYVAEFTLI